VGQSGASDVVSLATPPSCPDQVRNLRQSNMLQFEDANDDDEVVEVSENATVIEWDPPTDNGSKITDYKIHVTELNAEEKNAESNKQIYEVDGNVTSYSLILLNPGTMYRWECISNAFCRGKVSFGHFEWVFWLACGGTCIFTFKTYLCFAGLRSVL